VNVTGASAGIWERALASLRLARYVLTYLQLLPESTRTDGSGRYHGQMVSKVNSMTDSYILRRCGRGGWSHCRAILNPRRCLVALD